MDKIKYLKEIKNTTLEYRDKIGLPIDFSFGVEIEYENTPKDLISALLEEEKNYYEYLDEWVNKSEASVSAYDSNSNLIGGEISSPILKDDKESWKALSKILNLLKRNDAKICSSCGGHVNIGIHTFRNNIDHLKNLLLVWLVYHREIQKFTNGEFNSLRKDSLNYIKKLDKNIFIKEILEKRINSLYDFDKTLFDKKHEIYMHQLHYYSSYEDDRIEFRIPNGTLNEDIWQNNINFFSKLAISCQKEIDRELLIYKMNNKSHDAFDLADFVFDNEKDKRLFLVQALKASPYFKKDHVKRKQTSYWVDRFKDNSY